MGGEGAVVVHARLIRAMSSSGSAIDSGREDTGKALDDIPGCLLLQDFSSLLSKLSPALSPKTEVLSKVEDSNVAVKEGGERRFGRYDVDI